MCVLALTVKVFYTAYGSQPQPRRWRGSAAADGSTRICWASSSLKRGGGLWQSLPREDLRREIPRPKRANRVLLATLERLDLISRAFAEIKKHQSQS